LLQHSCKPERIVQWRFIAADGVEMPLEEGTSAFITMNPGYIGRAELPESLKALFRPITVVVPDRQLIMENMLMAEGFETAKMLAKKFAALYYLLEDLLSPQKHYDWGLRAIKSVLVVAGSLLRAEAGQDEADVLFRALRDFNIPKILNQDMVIFMGLLNDLFPGTDPPRKRDMTFEKVIVEETKKAGLTPEDDFILRVVQFSELMVCTPVTISCMLYHASPAQRLPYLCAALLLAVCHLVWSVCNATWHLLFQLRTLCTSCVAGLPIHRTNSNL
jgi:dynein heavy chain, axonemal